jgi:hypothetical protein
MELFRLMGTIAIDNTNANRAINDTAETASNAENEVSDAFTKIGGVAGKIATGLGVAGAAIGGAFIATIESTREYRKEMGLLESAFDVAGHSSKAAKDTYSELNAVLGTSGQAIEAAQHIAKIAKSEKDLSTWTDIATGVYSEFGEAIPIESLAEASLETQKSGELTGALVDALVWAGHSEEEFQKKLDGCTTEQERQKLIMDTLNSTYKEASDTYKETNKDILEAEKANERLADAFARIGEIGEPILTAIKDKAAEMMEVAIPKIESFIGKIQDASQWVKDNGQTIQMWAGIILGATVTIGTFLLILNWGALMTSAANAIKIVRTAILGMNAAMLANPIGLVVALLAGLVVAFIYLWNNCEGFRNFWLKLWDKIKDASSSAVSWISGKFDSLKSALDKAKTKFNEIQKTISDKMDSAQKAVKKAIDKIKKFFDFKWKLPSLKLPTVGIKGKFSIDPPSVPKFSVKWNAEGAILDKPTIFGKVGNTYLGGGEAGLEAVTPIDVLQDYVKKAVKEENGQIINALIEQNKALMNFLERIMPRQVMLDSGALVGELSPAIDTRLGEKYKYIKRGITR